MSVGTHPLEGDGTMVNLFYYLWKRKANTLENGLDVRIAPTVVYEHNFPKGWYFWSDKKDEIERRVGKEIDTEAIRRDFSKRIRSRHFSDLDVVASYMSRQEDSAGREQTVVEYFDRPSLHEFLTKRARRDQGILQRFIPPNGKHNVTMQAVWSPHVTLVEKRQNMFALNDRRFSAYQRVVTYEGPTYYSREAFVAPHIEKKVKDICTKFTDHFYNTEHVRIVRMVLYFRVDGNRNVWLLWASSVRIARKEVLDLAPRFVARENIAAPGSGDAASPPGSPLMLAENTDASFTFKSDGEFEGTGGDPNKSSAQQPRYRRPNPLQACFSAEQTKQHIEAALAIKLPSMGPIGDAYSDVPDSARSRRERQLLLGPSEGGFDDFSPNSTNTMPALGAGRIPQPPGSARSKERPRTVPTQQALVFVPRPPRRTGAVLTYRPTVTANPQLIKLMMNRSASFNRGNTSPGQMRRRRSTPDLGSSLTGLSGGRRVRKSAPDLWTMVRIAWLSRYLHLVYWCEQLREFTDTLIYELYSHVVTKSPPYEFRIANELMRLFGAQFIDHCRPYGLTQNDRDRSYYRFEKPSATMMQLQQSLIMWRDHMVGPLLESAKAGFVERIRRVFGNKYDPEKQQQLLPVSPNTGRVMVGGAGLLSPPVSNSLPRVAVPGRSNASAGVDSSVNTTARSNLNNSTTSFTSLSSK